MKRRPLEDDIQRDITGSLIGIIREGRTVVEQMRHSGMSRTRMRKLGLIRDKWKKKNPVRKAMIRNPRLDTDVEITEDDIHKALKRPESFGYSGYNKEMFETWALGPVIRTRDSGLLEQSNADALEDYLQSDPSLEDEWEITGANHWAVGWVDHLSFRVIDENGEPTRISRVIKKWFEDLDGYPIADEEDYSRRELEATVENIEQVGMSMVSDDATETWPYDVYSWLSNNYPSEIESREDQGGYPSDDSVKEALEDLGYLDKNYE